MADERSDFERRLEQLRSDLIEDGYDPQSESVPAVVEAIRVIGECRRAMAAVLRAKRILIVPAAEYVPAIPDAWKELDAALEIMARLGGGQGDG